MNVSFVSEPISRPVRALRHRSVVHRWTRVIETTKRCSCKARLSDCVRRVFVSVWISSLFVGLLNCAIAAEPTMLFRLADGSTVTGSLAASERAEQIAIASDWFSERLRFSTERLLEGQVLEGQLLEGRLVEEGTGGDNLENQDRQAGTLAFLLRDGALFTGRIASIETDRIRLDSKTLGEVVFLLSDVTAVFESSNTPARLSSLATATFRYRREPGWRFENDSLVGGVPDAAVVGELDLPDRFRLRLEVECDGARDFELSLGDRSAAGQGRGRVDRRGGSLSRMPSERFVTRLEWFDQSVSVVRSNASISDTAVIEMPDPEAGLELDLFVDQLAGRLLVFDKGLLLAEIRLTDQQPVLRRVLTLINRGDQVSVKRLDLFAWSGEVPASRSLPRRHVVLSDGDVLEEIPTDWDVDRIRVGGDWYSWNDVSQIMLGAPIDAFDGTEFTLDDGSRVRGRIAVNPGTPERTRESESNERILIEHALTGSRLLISPRDVVRVVGRAGEVESDAAATSQLVFDQTRLSGRLIDGKAFGQVFGFRGNVIENGVGLTATENVKVHVRAEREPKRPNENPSPREGLPTDSANDGDVSPSRTEMMELRSGDRLVGRLIEIDGKKVRFESSLTGEVSLPAIEVARIVKTRLKAIDPDELRWLLRLPRRSKDSPPTHILLSADGDMLRGKLKSLGQREVLIEVRGRTRQLQRNAIAGVVWIESDGAQVRPCRYVVTTGWGDRLGLTEATFDGETIRGRHGVLGRCRLTVGEIDTLAIGTREASGRERWELVPVKEPKTFE